MRAAVAIVVWAVLVLQGTPAAVAQGASAAQGGSAQVAPSATCVRQDFEAVVEAAASALRDLHQRNTPGFQDKLRLLRERKKWTAEEFMEKAAPFVQDERIAAYDQRSNDLLTKINSMGEAGAQAKTPDCRQLAELRATMKSLIDTQIEKWAYMFAKIERGLVN